MCRDESVFPGTARFLAQLQALLRTEAAAVAPCVSGLEPADGSCRQEPSEAPGGARVILERAWAQEAHGLFR
jgi:hypothetical protein